MPGSRASLLSFLIIVQDAVSRFTYWLGAAAIGLIVVIFSYEVTARYLFFAPTYWASDFVSFLLLISVFMVMPWLTREGGHVAVTLLPDTMPPRPAALLLRAGFLVGAVVCMWVGYISVLENVNLYQRNVSTLTTVRIPKWTLTALITYALFNSGLHFLRLVFTKQLGGGVSRQADV